MAAGILDDTGAHADVGAVHGIANAGQRIVGGIDDHSARRRGRIWRETAIDAGVGVIAGGTEPERQGAGAVAPTPIGSVVLAMGAAARLCAVARRVTSTRWSPSTAPVRAVAATTFGSLLCAPVPWKAAGAVNPVTAVRKFASELLNEPSAESCAWNSASRRSRRVCTGSRSAATSLSPGHRCRCPIPHPGSNHGGSFRNARDARPEAPPRTRPAQWTQRFRNPSAKYTPTAAPQGMRQTTPSINNPLRGNSSSARSNSANASN